MSEDQVERVAKAIRYGQAVVTDEQAESIARAAIAAMGEQWRDISSAPRDGTIVDLWHTIWKCSVACEWRKGFSPGHPWVEQTKTTTWPEQAFSHWRPRAASPVTE